MKAQKQTATKQTEQKPDRTEYCEQCRKYHERPTWPNCGEWLRKNIDRY